ncbi:hypothetical protein RND71_044018 [Anisodus tanguticus]|uniref:Protein SEC13 homolog n=1 Tax=Anisodus tanguticus TaxID=243964 RepID=A0AAE1UN37_9SOLA|nr:hypothetical protein RND71_044018 [Anisodus tanguticus]
MVSMNQQIDTNHEDMIHDAVADYFGTKLATCSSDRTIKLFSLNGTNHSLITELKGHEGPVWQLSWSHPVFGNLLASCSYDRKVIIWKETKQSVWEKVYEYNKHDSSVNAIDWAPKEFGLLLVCGSSDGALSIITCIDNVWSGERIADAHNSGVNAVCWSPPFSYGLSLFKNEKLDSNETNNQDGKLVKRFVSGGCDNKLKIWIYEDKEEKWIVENVLEKHTDWIRDVAWSPTIGSDKSFIASCSQDGKVIIWEFNHQENDEKIWVPKCLHEFNDVVWHVSWSTMGNILAVSGGDNQVTLWKENVAGVWHCINDGFNKGA